MKRTLTIRVAFILIIILFACNQTSQNTENAGDEKKLALTPDQVRTIIKEAYIYGFPIVDNCRVQYSYFVNKEDPDYKAPWNVLKNIPRVFTPEDKAIQTPNSDTPYSWIGLDLRTEPIIFIIPAIEKNRYWSLQLIDLYTHNFDYLGTRTTGNNGGTYMITGPRWNGTVPKGITKVIRCETEIASAQFRTQLYNPSDLENVRRIQNKYIVKTLSSYLGQPAPAPASPINFLKPLTPQSERTSLQFFTNLNFYLQFCPTHPSEKELMEKFTKVGIGAGKFFDTTNLTPDIKAAMHEGIADAWTEFETIQKRLAMGELIYPFGTRDSLKNNYLYRMAGAVLGIYGNTKEEAIYPPYYTDDKGQKLNGSNRYVIHFAPGQLPPVNSFWSITMYTQPASLLVANPINRYLLNSPMLPQFKKDADGGITIYIQNTTPGKTKESNWLPAPDGPFSVIMRLYLPKEEAIIGKWHAPPMTLVN
ncbi:DUF1254 domain-containing protein [Pollutibacter soli]|uniref:DUF1254 domain-containing protein n=1 Tax=Pollutibacter soli TaxID=3034157 RepID=UPI00301361B6